MTLANLKKKITRKLHGDKKPITETTELNEIIKEGIVYISQRTIPLDLISTDTTSYEVVRFINSTEFIRVPNDVTTDEDVIDIDEQLFDALVLYIVGENTKDKNIRLLKRKEIDVEIDIYENNLRTLLDSLELETEIN